MKKEFPYQIQIILGVIWLFVGIALHSGIELIIWVTGGVVFVVIGLLSRKRKLKNIEE